ncbi:hypothetical protein PCC7418_2844 [Halothece sp. PCC 7418]|nr:hypothetical protein PCC7418_2844 [Halothece sp. PCC 7418]
MLLPETEVQPALEQAQRAFPSFTIWGELTIEPQERTDIRRITLLG